MNFDEIVAQSHLIEKSCIAASTQKSYDSLIKSYKNGMEQIPGAPPPFPITEEKLRGFLTWYKMNHQTTTFGYLKQFTIAIAHFLSINNIPDFTKNESFEEFMKGLRHEMKGDSVPKAKLYIGKEMMDKLVKCDKTNAEMNAFISIMYYGFLRISECLNLRYKDVQIDENGRIKILIPYSKTDQNGKTVTIYISKTETSYSPFIWFLDYANATYDGDENKKIFKKTHTAYRSNLKKMIFSIGIDPTKYSSHSFRKGAAHEASNAGVNDCIIKAMGRWLSSCYTRYTSTTMKEAGDTISSYI